MDVLAQLLNVSNIVLCLAIVALVWIQRRAIELLCSKLFRQNINRYAVWSEFLIPLGPLATGALLTLIEQIPVPEMFVGGAVARMVFGLGLGLISGLIYRMIKKGLLDKLAVKEEKSLYLK